MSTLKRAVVPKPVPRTTRLAPSRTTRTETSLKARLSMAVLQPNLTAVRVRLPHPRLPTRCHNISNNSSTRSSSIHIKIRTIVVARALVVSQAGCHILRMKGVVDWGIPHTRGHRETRMQI